MRVVSIFSRSFSKKLQENLQDRTGSVYFDSCCRVYEYFSWPFAQMKSKLDIRYVSAGGPISHRTSNRGLTIRVEG